ncbi:HAMP domain-containing histidine kinase [Labedella populi]|uniref:Sensor histidine kinase MtrB n=1 Tax=Labedella populi TaxID=2498850 RepID=A0A444QGS3_9MICO|nr:MtrAB system histidine kinase MtrB [Labedella populi]RWZ68781.1 HAMP domain-containing histidine kinase [Labedella populi]
MTDVGLDPQRLVREIRALPRRVASVWRRSLQFKTVVVTLGLTGLAVFIAGAYMSVSIGNDLFQSRLEQVLVDSARAQLAAQRTFDAAETGEAVNLDGVMGSARNDIATVSSSRLITVYRVPGQEFDPAAPQDFESPGLDGAVISAGLREEVAENADGQWWQSVELSQSRGGSPAIVVGQRITVPGAGDYELYMGYDLSDQEETLQFVQRTLLLAGLALLALIGAVAWAVVRIVVLPIRIAAETSERLAAGELEVRIDRRGEDEIATLARSFNEMAESLQSRIKELAELSLVQQRFVSDVSHELRTPLTTIRLAGDVLYDQRTDFPPSTARTAELLHTQVERFELLLADLLEISRYDAGSAELETEPTSIARLAEDSVEELGELARQHGSDLRFVAPGGYTEIDVDPRRIRRIVRNLVGNAIEHGEGRPIVVSVDSSETAVALGVRDYGLGMAEVDAERVFDRFWRADPSRRRTIGGTGLGLSIAMSDTKLHGGALEVWSRPGEGSLFRLTLPRTPGAALGESPVPLPPVDADSPGAASLTVDPPSREVTP